MHLDGKILAVTGEFTKILPLQNFMLYRSDFYACIFSYFECSIRVLNVLLKSIDLILLMFHTIIDISIKIENIKSVIDIDFDTIC